MFQLSHPFQKIKQPGSVGSIGFPSKCHHVSIFAQTPTPKRADVILECSLNKIHNIQNKEINFPSLQNPKSGGNIIESGMMKYEILRTIF